MAHRRPIVRAFHALVPAAALAGAVLIALAGLSEAMRAAGALLLPVVIGLLLLAIFSSVHHADVIAHRTGEPYGTLVLTVAITVIELALILSVALSGEGSPTLARDTVFAVVMLVTTGVVGLCLLVGGLRFGEAAFRRAGASAYLGVLIPLATLALVFPNYTTSTPGPYFTPVQLAFVSVATLLLYAAFLYVQTVRHRDYFLSDSGTGEPVARPGPGTTALSVVALLAALAAVVLLAKDFSILTDATLMAAGAPVKAIGVIVAALVLMPETISALRSAARNDIQKSLNLALGSSLSTIGLTIPAVGVLSLALGRPLALGLEPRDIAMLVLVFAVSLVTFGRDRTSILQGFVHLLLFGVFLLFVFVP